MVRFSSMKVISELKLTALFKENDQINSGSVRLNMGLQMGADVLFLEGGRVGKEGKKQQ